MLLRFALLLALLLGLFFSALRPTPSNAEETGTARDADVTALTANQGP